MSEDISSAVEGLLKSFGVTSTSTRNSIEEIVVEELKSRSHDARIASLRHGVLTLESSSVGVEFLRYDQDLLLEVLQERAPGVVSSIRLRVARQG